MRSWIIKTARRMRMQKEDKKERGNKHDNERANERGNARDK
jgi:hypothetical protein